MKHYKVAYEVERGEFSREYLEKNGLGGCDRLLIHSIIDNEDGSRSEMILPFSEDHFTDLEVLKSAFCLVEKLEYSARQDISIAAKKFMRDVRKVIRPDIYGTVQESLQ